MMAEGPLNSISSGGEGPKFLHSKVLNSKANNKKQTVELIVLAVLLCIFGYLVKTTFFKGQPAAVPPSTPSAVVPAQAVAETPSAFPVPEEVASELAKSEEDEGWGRSPFSLLSQNEERRGGAIEVQGIVVDSGQEAYAIINQKIVKVGDQIDDKKVKAIASGVVTLETADGQEVVLKS